MAMLMMVLMVTMEPLSLSDVSYDFLFVMQLLARGCFLISLPISAHSNIGYGSLYVIQPASALWLFALTAPPDSDVYLYVVGVVAMMMTMMMMMMIVHSRRFFLFPLLSLPSFEILASQPLICPNNCSGNGVCLAGGLCDCNYDYDQPDCSSIFREVR